MLHGRLGSTLAARRKLVPGLVALVVAVALVCGSLQAGARYFFCPEMDRLADHPCCLPTHDDAPPTDLARVEAEDDCCARLSLGRLPPAAGSPAKAELIAPILAILLPVRPITEPPHGECERSSNRDRIHAWRSRPPPTARERCAFQSVFLI